MDTSVIIALLGVVSSVSSFMFGRRKRHVEVVGQELSNMQKAIQVWKDVAEYQTGEIATLRGEINNLKKELLEIERLYRKRFMAQYQTCTNYQPPTHKKNHKS